MPEQASFNKIHQSRLLRSSQGTLNEIDTSDRSLHGLLACHGMGVHQPNLIQKGPLLIHS